MAELCLAFANTLCWRGSEPPSEALRSLGDLLAWCASAGGQDDPMIEELAGWWRAHPVQGAEAFAEAVGLREVIYHLFRAAAMIGEPAAADLDRLNLALAATPARVRLARHGDGYAWQMDRSAP